MATSEQLSVRAYLKWQQSDTLVNRINFLNSIRPYIATSAWITLNNAFKHRGLTDKQDYAEQVVSDVWLFLDKVDRKKRYKQIIKYIGMYVEHRLLNIVQFERVQKRTGHMIYLNDIHEDKHGRPQEPNILKTYDKQDNLYEVVGVICKRFAITGFKKQLMFEKFCKGMDFEEMAKKHNTSRQYLHKIVYGYIYRIKSGNVKFKKQIRESLSENRERNRESV